MEQYMNYLWNPVANNMANQSIAECTQNIANAKATLEKMLKKEGITDDEKKSINELLDKLKAQEDKLKEITNNTSKLTPNEALTKTREIEAAIKEILSDINKLATGEKVESDKDDKDDKKADETDNDETGKVNKDDKANNDNKANENDKTNKNEKDDKTQGSDKLNLSSDVKTNIEIFYDAIDGPGTKNSELESVISSIDADNVMEYMVGWNKYHSTQNGESFMEAFVWDADHTQKKNGCRQIEYALREKAEELGIYDECRADFAAIDKELSSWFWISNDISQNFDNIIQKIAAKMGGEYKKYSSPQKK
jgi:hypothetical protein